MLMYLSFFFFLMKRRPPRSTQSGSSAASDVYKRQSMDMDAERLSAHHLGMHSGGIRQPVVGMNNIKFLLASHYSGNHREVVYLFVQVAGITAGKVHTALSLIHI